MQNAGTESGCVAASKLSLGLFPVGIPWQNLELIARVPIMKKGEPGYGNLLARIRRDFL